MRKKKRGEALDPALSVGYELLKNREAINYVTAARENASKAVRQSYTEAYRKLNNDRVAYTNKLIQSDNPDEVTLGKQLQVEWNIRSNDKKPDGTLIDALGRAFATASMQQDEGASFGQGLLVNTKDGLQSIRASALYGHPELDNLSSYLSRLNSTQADSGIGALMRLDKYENHINNYLKALDAKQKIGILEQQESVLQEQAMKTSDPHARDSYLKRLYSVRDSKYALANQLNAYQKDIDVLEKADPTALGSTIDNVRKSIEDLFNPLFETTPMRDVLNDAKAPLYDLKSLGDAEKRSALEQALKNIADLKPLLQANVEQNRKDAAHYERRINPEFIKKRDQAGMDFFDPDTYLYKLSGVMGSSGTSWRTQLASIAIGAVGGALSPYTGGGSVAVAAPIVYGLNYSAGLDENQAEVATAAREKFTAMLGGENSAKYKQFVKESRAQLPKNMVVTDAQLVDMYLIGQIGTNRTDIKRAKIDTHRDIENLFQKDMVATTADNMIDTALTVMPFGSTAKQASWLTDRKWYKRLSAVPRYLRRKGAAAREAYEATSAFGRGAAKGAELFAPLGAGGTVIGSGIGGVTNTAIHYIGKAIGENNLTKLGSAFRETTSRMANAIERITPQWLEKFAAKPTEGISGNAYKEMNRLINGKYGKSIAKRLLVSGISEGVEEGKQYQNAEDFKKGYTDRQLRTDVLSLAFDDFMTGLDVGKDILSIPLDTLGILSIKDKNRLAEIKGGMLAGLTHVGSIGVASMAKPYLQEKSASRFLVENMLNESAVANDKLDRLMRYSAAAGNSSSVQALEQAFANFKQLNEKQFDKTGNRISSDEDVNKEYATFRRAIGLSKSDMMHQMAERADVDTKSKDYNAFVATYMMAYDNFMDKSKEFAKNEHARNVEANKILSGLISDQTLEDAGIPEALRNDPKYAGERDFTKHVFVEQLARLQALLETKQELEDALKAGANKAQMRKYIDGIEHEIDIVKNGIERTDQDTGEVTRVGGLSKMAQQLFSPKLGVYDKAINFHAGQSINTLDDIAAVTTDQDAQDKLADIYRQSYLEQFNVSNAAASLEQITGTTKLEKDENGANKVVVDKKSQFNDVWKKIRAAREDNDVFWNELTADAFKTDEELEADRNAGEQYESGWKPLEKVERELAVDANGEPIAVDENTKLGDNQEVIDGYVYNVTKRTPIKERPIFSQDDASELEGYSETVDSAVDRTKIAYGYENSADEGFVTSQIDEAKAPLIEAQNAKKRVEEAAKLIAEMQRKADEEANAKREAFVKLNPKYKGASNDVVDKAIAKHETRELKRKQREDERHKRKIAKGIERHKLTKLDGQVYVDDKGVSHQVYQRKNGSYVITHWDENGTLKETRIDKSNILTEKQALISNAYTKLVDKISQLSDRSGQIMNSIMSKINILDLSESGVVNTYTQLYKLFRVAYQAQNTDVINAISLLRSSIVSTGYSTIDDYHVAGGIDSILNNDAVEQQESVDESMPIEQVRIDSMSAPIVYHNGKTVNSPTVTVTRGMSLSDAIKKARSGDQNAITQLSKRKQFLEANLNQQVQSEQYPGDEAAVKELDRINKELDEINKSPEDKAIYTVIKKHGLTKTDDVYTYKNGSQTPVYVDQQGRKCIISNGKKGYRVNYAVKFNAVQPTQTTPTTTTTAQPAPSKPAPVQLTPQQQTVKALDDKRAEDKNKVGVDGYELTGRAYFIKVNGQIQRHRRVHSVIPEQTKNMQQSVDSLFNKLMSLVDSDDIEQSKRNVVDFINGLIKNGVYAKHERDRYANDHVTAISWDSQHVDYEKQALSAQSTHDLGIYLRYITEQDAFYSSDELVATLEDIAHIIASTEPGTSVHVGNVVEGVVNYVVQRVLEQGYDSIVGTEEQLVDEILGTRSHDSFMPSATPESGEYGANRTYDEWFDKNRSVVKALVSDVLRQLKVFNDLGLVVQSEKITLYGEFQGVGRVAGEPDLTAIDKDGGIHMIDIKTSMKSFYNGQEYSERYTSVYGKSWGQLFSTQQQYSNQQTAYRMLMKKSLGLDTTAELMPYVVSYNYTTGLISNVVLEPRIPIDYQDSIEALFNGTQMATEQKTSSGLSVECVQNKLDTYYLTTNEYRNKVSDFENQFGELPSQFRKSTPEIDTAPEDMTLDALDHVDTLVKDLNDTIDQIDKLIEQKLADEQKQSQEEPAQATPQPEPANQNNQTQQPSPSAQQTGLIKLQDGRVYKLSFSAENPYPQIQSDRAERDKEFASVINAPDFGLPETTFATISNTGDKLDSLQIKIRYKDRKTGKIYKFGIETATGKRDYIFLNQGNNLPGHAITQNFQILYDLAKQLVEYNKTHKGKKAIIRVTEWYRTDGRLIYNEKNGEVSNEMHPVADPKLGMVTDDLYKFSAEQQVSGDERAMLNDIGFVKNGVVYTYGDTRSRQSIWTVSDKLPNGTIVYAKRIPRAENPNGFSRLPIVLMKRALSEGDVNFIMDVLKNPALLGQTYNGLHGATIGSISNLILPIITDSRYLSTQRKLFVDPVSNTVYYITAKDWEDAKNHVEALHGYNMMNDNHVAELKEIIKRLSIEVNSDMMQSRFGVDADTNLPLKAIREWFNNNPSQNTFTVRGSLGDTSISFDRNDFQNHTADNGDVYNGLSGAGWYLRSGILQTNAVGIGAPHVHINAVTIDTKGYDAKTLFDNGAVVDDTTKSEPETAPANANSVIGQQFDSALDAMAAAMNALNQQTIAPDVTSNIDDTVPDADLFHIGRVVPGKRIDKKKARKHVKHILGKEFVEDSKTFDFIDGVIKQLDGDTAVLGVCRSDAIRISSLAENGVEYHEAFHRIFELVIPEHLRDSIYEKVAADNNIDLQNDSDYKNHRKVAELMADWYWEYQTGKYHVDSYNMFANMWNRMRDFALRFSKKYRNDRAILNLFSDIRRGKYASRKSSDSAIKRFVTNFKNYLMYKQHGKDFKHVVGDEMYYHIVESAKFFVFAGLDITANGSNISDLSNSLDKATIIKGAKRLADAGNDILGINLSDDQKSEGQKALFEFIDNLDDIQFKLDLANSIKAISTNFEQVESEKADEDADSGEAYSVNQSIEGHIKDAVEFDPFTKTSQQVRFFFATISNYQWTYTPQVVDGKIKLVRTKKQVLNEYGLPEFIPVREAYNKFVNTVHNIDTIDELLDVLQKKSEIEPFYETIAENIRAVMNKRMSYDGKSTTYDIAAENLLAQIIGQVRSNKYNMVTMMSSKAQQGADTTFGEYNTRVMPTGVEYQARNTAIAWSSSLANGGTSLVKITKAGKRVINPNESGAATVFSNFSQFLDGKYDKGRLSLHEFLSLSRDGKLGLNQYLGIQIGNNILPIRDTDDAAMHLTKEYIVQQLNSMGINIELNAFNYMLVEKYGNSGADSLLKMLESSDVKDSMTTFMQFLDNIVVDGKLNVTDDNKYVVGYQKTPLDLLYTKFAFTSDLANWQYRYKQTTTQLSIKGSGNNLKYLISQNNFLTDSTRDFNKRGPQFQLISSGSDPYIYSTRVEQTTGQPIWAGSFVVNQLLANKNTSIELQMLDGFRTDNKNDYGADYFQMTNDEDVLSKIRFLMDNSLVFQTLSDKKTYFAVHLKGFRIPGIDYSRMYDNAGNVIIDANALGDQIVNGSCSYNVAGFDTPVLMQQKAVIDQLLSYAYAERESIIKTIDAMSEMTDEEKKKAVKNFYSTQNGAKFSSLLGIWPVTESGVGHYVSFNNSKITPKQALERADANFFAPTVGDRPMTERQAEDYRKTLIEMVLQKRLDAMMNNLQQRGLIEKDSDGFLVNKGLPADAIQFIAKSLLRRQNKLDAVGNAIDQNTMRTAIHTAIGLFANDMMVKSIMSVQETERIYAANPAYFKWKYDKQTGELSDRTVDELKRAGGFISTGINNFTELTNIPQHWLDENGKFKGEYRCCEIKDEEVASPQIETIKTLMTTSARVQALREHLLKHEKDEYEKSLLGMSSNERPDDYEQLQERKSISEEVEKKLAAMDESQVEQELKSLGVLDVVNAQAESAYDSYTGGIDVNDGGAYITDDMCEMLLRMVGSYSPEVAKAFEILRSTSVKNMYEVADAYTKVITTVIGTQKYTAYGRRQDAIGNIVDYYHKYALFPIFPMLATGKIGNIYNMMKTNDVDMVLISSAVKVGSQGAVANPKWDDYRQDADEKNKANYNPDGSLKPIFSESFKVNPYSVSFDYLRKQLNTDPNEKKYMNIGTQTTKIALTNLNLHASYLTRTGEVKTGQQIHDDIMGSMRALSDIGARQMRDSYFLTNKDGEFVDEDGNVTDNPVVDATKYSNALKRVLGSDKISLNLAQAIQLTQYTDTEGRIRYRFNMPVDAVQTSNFLESKIISDVNKAIIDTKTPGAAFVQRSVWSMEGSTLYDSRKGNIVSDENIAPSINGGNRLQMVNEDGSMDCILSIDFFTKILGDFLHYTTGGEYITDDLGNRIVVTKKVDGRTLYKVRQPDVLSNSNKLVETWVDSIDNLSEGTELVYKRTKVVRHTRSFKEARQYLIDQGVIGPKAKCNVLAYRIPTQAQSSIHALRCVDVLPVVNDTVVLPAEFTKITGSDFDIDKLYLTALNYQNTEDGGVTDVFNEGSEKYYQNTIVNAYLALLTDRANEHSDPRSFISLHRSIDNDTQLAFDALDDIGTTDAAKVEQPYQFYDLTTQTNIKNSYITGKIGIGPFALNNNNHILTWLYHVSFRPSANSIMTTFGLNNLDNMTDVDGNSIMGWLSAFINGHVDIAKDAWVSRCNVNPFTYNLTNLLLRTGWGKNTIFFLRQPIMMAMANAYMNASSEYMSDGTSKFRRQQVAIDKVVFGEDSAYHLENVEVAGKAVKDWLDVFESLDPETIKEKSVLNAWLKNHLTRSKMLAEAKTPIGETGSLQFQAAIYLAYKQFDKYANALSNLVKYCKIDTKKQGKSVAEQLVWYEGYNDLFNDGTTGQLFNRAALEELKNESYVGSKTENAVQITKQIIGGQFFSGAPHYLKTIADLSKLVGNTSSYQTVNFVQSAMKAISAEIKSGYFNYYVTAIHGVNSTYIKDLVNGSSERHSIMYHHDKKAPYIEVEGDMEHPLRNYLNKPIKISWKSKTSTVNAMPNIVVAVEGNKIYLQKPVTYRHNGKLGALTGDYKLDAQFTQGNNTIYDRIGTLKTLIETNSALADLKNNVLLRDIVLAATQKYAPGHKQIIGEASDTYDDLKFIKLETFFDDNGDKTDQYIRAWDAMLRYTNENEALQNSVRKLANDLVVYAFITSGDTKGSTKLFQYVPASWRNGEFNQNGVVSYAEYIRNRLDDFNGEGRVKVNLDDVILNNWQDNQFVPIYRVDKNANEQRLTPIFSDGRNVYGYPVVLQGMNIDKDGNVNVVIDPETAPQYIKISRDYKHRNSQRQYSVYRFHSVAKTSDGVMYPVYTKVEPKGITIKGSGGTYMVTEYGRTDRRDDAERSTIPDLFELLYTAQNFEDKLRNAPKSALTDSSILSDLRRFAEEDLANKQAISARSYSSHMEVGRVHQIDEFGLQNIASAESINIFAGTNEHTELSNFAIRPFTHTFENGSSERFQSVEQAFHYIKATMFANPSVNGDIIDKIMKTTNGRELKTLGRSIRQLDTTRWDSESSNVMKQLLQESFEQNPDAAKALLDTGDAQLTHLQDNSKWKTEFPRLLMEVRDELRKQQPQQTQTQQVQKTVTLSTVGYKKGDPQAHPDTDYVFTENAEAASVVLNSRHGTLKPGLFGKEELPYKGKIKINVSDVHGTNQAGIRTDASGNITSNAYGIVVKKYQHDANGKFVAKEGQFKDTDRDFETFKLINGIVFRELEQSKNDKIVFPTQFALGKAALPQRFAQWLRDELEQRFGVQSTVERNTRSDYDGYGLNVTGVKKREESGFENVLKDILQKYPESSAPKTNQNTSSSIKLTQGQESAKKAILNFIKTVDPTSGEYFTLTGKAGTGKTTLIQEVIRELAKENPYQRFVVSAIAHKAVQVIYGKTKDSARYVTGYTVASVLGMKRDNETGNFVPVKGGKSRVKDGSILFIDEASMLNEQNVSLLMNAAKSKYVKVIFLGDPGQLPPIRTGELVKHGVDSLSPVFKAAQDKYSSTLTERVRQGEGSPILDYADTFWNYSTTEGQTDQRVDDESMTRKENAQGSIDFINASQMDKIVSLFKQAVETNNPSLIKIVAYHNKAVSEWNQDIRHAIYGDEYSPNPLPGDILMLTDQYNDPINTSMPLLYNSEDVSVISTGDIYNKDGIKLMDVQLKGPRGNVSATLMLPTPQNNAQFRTNKQALWAKAVKAKGTPQYRIALDQYWNYGTDWAHAEYGYAITSHKSQGSTYDISVVDRPDIESGAYMSDISKSRSIYTAITRARNAAVIMRGKPGTLEGDLKQLNDRINGYKDGSITPPTQITSETEDNVGNTYREDTKTIQSEKTILSNDEILKLRPFTGNDKAPRVVVASEHSDPVFHVKQIKDFFAGKTSITQWGGNKLTANDVDAMYIITKHDGLPLRDLLSIKIPKIIHFSITGLGGTKFEPGVMPYGEMLDRIQDYIKQGLDPSMVTVRIDPIVPGVTKQSTIEDIIKRSSAIGIKNIRFSIMDFYPTTAQFQEAAGYDYSKYYEAHKNADGTPQVTLISRDGRSFTNVGTAVTYKQIGKALTVMKQVGANTIIYVKGKNDVLTKTIPSSNVTDDAIKSKDGWSKLSEDQTRRDPIASRVQAGVFLQQMYNLHAKTSVIQSIANIVKRIGDKYGVRLSTCAEISALPAGISHEGCLSVNALNDILGTHIEDKGTANNKSRALCACYGGKTDILKYNDLCASSCAYCYAHHNSNAAATMYNSDGTLKHNALTTTRRDTEQFDDTDVDDKFILHCKR